MEHRLSIDAPTMTLALTGRFTFTDYQSFRDVLGALANAQSVDTLVVDLAGLDFIDSSAIGMLMVANDEAKARRQKMTIINARAQVAKALEIVAIDQVIHIQKTA
jgi:HptB-dependent secretion and biofilm anti anti-sigma factor